MDSYVIDNTKLRTVTLTPEMIEDNPIYLTTIFQDESTQNKKVGYMVYNHFTDGYNDDSRYNEQFYTEFNKFKAEGVEEFVLDLRYNGGGLVTCAQILSWMLAPQNAIGQPFCKVVYNDVVNIKNTYNIESCEANINIPRLFVLTSFRTASASEAIINGLRPFYDVILIGGTTEGKNVGSVTLSDDKYEYELHPIVCQIYNSLDNSDYADGFQPDWAEGKKELLISSHIELGDKDNDPLLREAIRRIGSGSVAHATRDASSSLPVMKRGYNSLSNKKNLGFIDK